LTMAVTYVKPQPDLSIKSENIGPTAFFQVAYRVFQQAERTADGPIDRFYTLGGDVIRLRFAGPALVSRITPALEHIATEPSSSPVLTICLWDSISTGTQMPPPPWSADAYISRGEVSGYNNGRIHTAFHVGANVLNLLDTESDLALFWTRDASQLPYYESGAPLRTILDWWLSSRGRQLVHAAAVGTAQGGVLLAGKGGSGKSTTALACLNSKLLYAADDYCLLAQDRVPYVYSLYNSAKVNADNVHRIPHLRSAISNANRLDTEKALLFLHEHCPHRIVTGFPIRALLLPRVTGQPETRLTPASPIAGLKALAPSTIFQLSGAGRGAFQTMARIVKQIPCHYLELGTDISKIPDGIMTILSGD